jgi:hypothetical protein
MLDMAIFSDEKRVGMEAERKVREALDEYASALDELDRRRAEAFRAAVSHMEEAGLEQVRKKLCTEDSNKR